MQDALPDFSENQNKALDFHWEVGNCAWFMPPGMGKTRAYIKTIHDSGDRTLVFAPKLVCADTWPRENKKWGFNLPMRNLRAGKDRHLHGREQISLINPEAAPWLVEKLLESRTPPYKTVILDELSLWKSTTAKRVQEFMKLWPRIDYVVGGTGTPVGAHLKDLYGEMLCVDGGETFGDLEYYDEWKARWFFTCPYTSKVEPYSDTEADIMKKLRRRAISFDINDLDMPPVKHLPHYLDLPPLARQAYEEMHEHSAVEELDLYAANAAVRSGKLRQMSGGGVIDLHGGRKYLHNVKAEHLKNILEEHDGRPVLVFFEFASDYETICQTLGYTVPALYGKTKPRDAQRWLRDWNAGRLPVLALHPRSAAYGLNMQDSGNVIVWYTLPWSFEMVNQGIARLWRQGQKNNVLVYYLLVSETEDERVYERVEEREATHTRVMKGLLK